MASAVSGLWVVSGGLWVASMMLMANDLWVASGSWVAQQVVRELWRAW